MLFPQDIVQRIPSGQVRLAFRRWMRPSVKAGTRLRTVIGVVVIESVEPVPQDALTAHDATLAGYASVQQLRETLRREGTLYRIALRYEGADPRIALRDAPPTDQERDAVIAKLAAMDQRARNGAFTRRFLELIEQAPQKPAATLARKVGMELLPFKAQVRRLKELGLTESLDVGYRLSPRGREILTTLKQRA